MLLDESAPKIQSRITQAYNFSALLIAFDALFVGEEIHDFPTSGTFGVRIRGQKARKTANANAKAILRRVGDDPSLLTEQDKQILMQYSGRGGIGDDNSLFEYYTPEHIAEGLWDGLRANGFQNGNTLEPSPGAGVFNHTKPKGTRITGSEIDGVSAGVNQLLHPEDKIHNTSFEKLAMSVDDDHFDSVIGNVPFGDKRGAYAQYDPEYEKLTYIEQYFVTRVIDKVKPGGLICLVVPVNIIEKKGWENYRESLCRKAEFLGAHKLPTDAFGGANGHGTSTVTDVLVMRKHSKELAEMLVDLPDDTLSEANVLFNTFIMGNWFKSNEGKKFIMGELDNDGNYGSVSVKSNVTNADMKAKLAKRFKSRIDWDLLETAESVSHNYAEGDRRMINGRWHELQNGEWEKHSFVADDGVSIDANTYGVSNIVELNGLLESPNSALGLTFEQANSAYGTWGDLFENRGQVRDAIRLARTMLEEYREQVYRGGLIGADIDLLNQITNAGGDDVILRERIQKALTEDAAQFGIARGNADLTGITGVGANLFNNSLHAIDKNGKFSDLVEGVFKGERGEAYDPENAAEVINYLYTQADLQPVPFELFLETYQGPDKERIQREGVVALAGNNSIAIDENEMLVPWRRFITGDTHSQIGRLQQAMTADEDQRLINKWQAQIDEIRKARPHTPLDKIKFKFSSKWYNPA